MQVFKTIPKEDLEKIRTHGLASLIYQIENGLTDTEIPNNALDNPAVRFRVDSIFFGLKKYTPSGNLVQLAYEVNPDSTFVFNADFATGSLATPDPRYMDARMTLTEFLQRSQNYSHFLLDPLTAHPLDVDPKEFWENRKLNPNQHRFYNPEAVIERRVIPFSELQLVTD